MNIESQNVTDYPNTNTIFMVWRLINNPQLKDTFQQLCALVLNLNNSVFNRFPDSRASCVMGIWLQRMEYSGTSDSASQRIGGF